MFGGLFDLDGDGELEAWEMAVCEEEDVEEMKAELEEYYEAAGFADFHERVLKDADNDTVKAMYSDTFPGK